MKNVLVVIQSLRRGGVELAAINFAVNLNKDNYNVSFLLINPDESQDASLEGELVNQGYRIDSLPSDCNGYYNRYKYLCSYFKNSKYDVVHSHVILFSGIVLAAAKKNGVPVRVAHSHITKWNHEENLKYKLYRFVMRSLLNRSATVKLACSDEAGIYLYGSKEYKKSGEILPNAIDCSRFSFSEEKRNAIRNEFGIDSSVTLIGHIGTIYKIKNQVFIADVLSQMERTDQNVKCLLVGEPLEKDIVENRAKQLGVADSVIFAGARADTYAFYSAFDITVFPSLHEGLPLSLIEAQAAKLPCLVSDTVNHEVKFNSNVRFCSLNASPEVWAQNAFELLSAPRLETDNENLICNYDINNVIKKLEFFYSA